MANVNAPFGFMQYGSAGSVPTFQQSVRLIAPGDATPIYSGDPVSPNANGYISRAVAGTVRVEGIFVGCKYQSVSQKRTLWMPYWPGVDAVGDVTAYVISDPGAMFKVQGGAAVLDRNNIGEYIQFNQGTGNPSTGRSGAWVETPATTVTLPFIIHGLITEPPGDNGTDLTTPYNLLIVGFNNQSYRTNGAGPVGIA